MGKSPQATYRALEHFFGACETRMERRDRLARTHVKMATFFSWALFLGCLAAAAGVFAVALTDGSIIILCVCAGIVALGTFALVDHTLLWETAGRCADRIVGLSGKKEMAAPQERSPRPTSGSFPAICSSSTVRSASIEGSKLEASSLSNGEASQSDNQRS